MTARRRRTERLPPIDGGGWRASVAVETPLVTISGLPDEAVHAAPEYWRPIAARDECPRCGLPRAPSRKTDDPIVRIETTRSPLAPAWGVQPRLLRTEFYEAIREHLPLHMRWRVVLGSDRRPLDAVGVLVRPRHRPLGQVGVHTPER